MGHAASPTTSPLASSPTGQPGDDPLAVPTEGWRPTWLQPKRDETDQSRPSSGQQRRPHPGPDRVLATVGASLSGGPRSSKPDSGPRSCSAVREAVAGSDVALRESFAARLDVRAAVLSLLSLELLPEASSSDWRASSALWCQFMTGPLGLALSDWGAYGAWTYKVYVGGRQVP